MNNMRQNFESGMNNRRGTVSDQSAEGRLTRSEAFAHHKDDEVFDASKVDLELADSETVKRYYNSPEVRSFLENIENDPHYKLAKAVAAKKKRLINAENEGNTRLVDLIKTELKGLLEHSGITSGLKNEINNLVEK